jgi:hypothetical protein
MPEPGIQFEHVNKYCFLEDMITEGGGAKEAACMQFRCAWNKFRELTTEGVSARLKYKIYSVCIKCDGVWQ